MSCTTVTSYPTTLSESEIEQIRAIISRSVLVWLQDVNSQAVAAEWYELGERLCRRSVRIDDVFNTLERFRPGDMPAHACGDQSWAALRSFIRYYIIRGYQDAIK